MGAIKTGMRLEGGSYSFHLVLRRLLLGIAIGLSPMAQADTVSYKYDALGRVLEAINATSGQATQYSYDAVGNITAVKNVALTTVSVAGFTPIKGAVGAQVTLLGTGFSTTPALNAVSFNGKAATVLSSPAPTATQLVVNVPSGATSGPISITVGGVSAASSSSFTVLTNSGAPTISSFTPTVAAAGTAVTITGTNYQTTLGLNRISFNQSSANVTSATATTLGTIVPANASSGKIQVTTPLGSVLSSADFVIPPPGYTPSNIASSGRMPAAGTAKALTLTSGKASLQLFEGAAGQYLLIGISANTLPSATIKVFRPDGGELLSTAVLPTTPSIQLPPLPATGTYTIVVDPGTNAGDITLTIYGAVTGALNSNGTPLTIALTPAGRRASVTFSGSALAFVTLAISDVTLPSGKVTVLKPDGTILLVNSLTTAGLTLKPQLPMGGTYTILVEPTGLVGGSLTLKFTNTPTPTLTTTQTSYTATLSGQAIITPTFNATAGQNLVLAIQETGSTVSAATVTIRDPHGVKLRDSTFRATNCTSGCTPTGYHGYLVINLGPIAVAGTYTVQIQQTATTTGTLKVTLSSPISATLTADAAVTPTTIARVAQPMQFQFMAAEGQNLSLAILESQSNIQAVYVTVLKPNGGILLNTQVWAEYCYVGCTPRSYSAQAVLNLGPIPESGIYTAILRQAAPNTGVLSVGLMSPQSAALALGTPSTVTISAAQPGRAVEWAFAGTSGQRLALAVQEVLSNMTGIDLTVFDPAGLVLAKTSANATYCNGCRPNSGYSAGAFLNLGPLPTTGSYRVLATQSSARAGAVTASLSSPATGSGLTLGGTVNITTTRPGQGMTLTLSGAGSPRYLTVTETLSHIRSATVTVRTSGGAVVATSPLTASFCPTCSPINYSGSVKLNLGTLASGTYTVTIEMGDDLDQGTLSFALTSL